MDTMGFKEQVAHMIIDAICESNEDLTKYGCVRVVSDEELRLIASEITEERRIVTFFKNKPGKVLTVVKSQNLIHVGEDLSVVH